MLTQSQTRKTDMDTIAKLNVVKGIGKSNFERKPMQMSMRSPWICAHTCTARCWTCSPVRRHNTGISIIETSTALLGSSLYLYSIILHTNQWQ